VEEVKQFLRIVSAWPASNSHRTQFLSEVRFLSIFKDSFHGVTKRVIRVGLRAVVLLASVAAMAAVAPAQTPANGAKAPDFTLATPLGVPVTLAKEEGKGPIVLVVLRGYPGYQCPYCMRQVHDFIEHASEFAAHHAEVLLVYPGPPADLDQKAKEFLAKQAELPANIKLVIDPDYGMTNKYGLRWDAPKETAYPSTFILDSKGVVVFEKISKEHGDRTSAVDVLGILPK
jgi:peroxiredoxin Q/BCP